VCSPLCICYVAINHVQVLSSIYSLIHYCGFENCCGEIIMYVLYVVSCVNT
jgi:hypothetical protein